MKKIIVSAAVAALALTTTASALEDIKVNGQAKLWYETDNKGSDRELLNRDSASGEVSFKLGVTGKQGSVGFGTTVYQSSTMGLENNVVSAVRTNANELSNTSGNADMYLGELYFTAPLGSDTLFKFGKQELDTPLAFTERWNSLPNTFNAAVAINSSINNLTLIAAYIGEGNADNTTHDINGTAGGSYVNGSFKANDTFNTYYGGAYAAAALYKQGDMSANFWAYYIQDALEDTVLGTGTINAYAAWLDLGVSFGDANAKAYLAYMGHNAESSIADALNDTIDGVNGDATIAVAASADMTFSGVKLFGAASFVTEGDIAVANTATGFKKTKLPTAGIYTDGLYVAQPGSIAFKLSAATKIAETGLSLNAVNNTNTGEDGQKMGLASFEAQTLETTEIYGVVTHKLGDINLKGIIMHRMFEDDTTDDNLNGQHIRVVASVNF